MSDTRAELVRIAASLERLTALILPIAEPGNPKRMTKDEAFACLSYTLGAIESLRRVVDDFNAMLPPQGTA